jgi:4a-hydroxytetrahydrobiopterin dehydratase
MSTLASRQCVPCKSGASPLEGDALSALRAQLDPGWDVVDQHHLSKLYEFPNFVDALAYVNAVGALAEEQAHHPDLHLAWGRVRVEIWTHKIQGLHEADFVFAAKCDTLYSPS